MLPWKLKRSIEKTKCTFHYFRKYRHRENSNDTRKKITFICGFHGKSGGSQAIASIANLLSKNYNVTFISTPTSHINHLLSTSVKINNTISNSDIFICDLSINLDTLRQLKQQQKKIIVSIHGLKTESHQLPQAHIKTVLQNVDQVHFVSDVQQNSYNLAPNKYFVIPNTTKPVNKKKFTSNIGTVGNLNEKKKGAITTVKLGLASNAKKIHLWSIEHNIWKNSRVKCHQWESNKAKIYNSFDVLVFMSESETFGLVVIEAMSAGIPCVLSNIPVFKQFESCSGVVITNEHNSSEAVAAINYLLKHKREIAEQLKAHYQTYYSESAILVQWEAALSNDLYLEKEADV